MIMTSMSVDLIVTTFALSLICQQEWPEREWARREWVAIQAEAHALVGALAVADAQVGVRSQAL